MGGGLGGEEHKGGPHVLPWRTQSSSDAGWYLGAGWYLEDRNNTAPSAIDPKSPKLIRVWLK
jgi:hypothetical protein